MTRLWEEVLDLQIDTHNWLTSTDGVNFGIGWQQSATDSVPEAKHNAEVGARWALQTAAMVFNAEPITVDADMMTVVRSAVEGFQPEPLVETDLLTDNGFLVLPSPMEVIDIRGRRITWTAASWITTGSGINLCLFHDTAHPDDFPVPKRPGLRLVPTHVRRWRWGETLTDIFPEDVEERIAMGLTATVYPGGGETVHRQVQAIWRLLSQPLATRTSDRPSRPFRRRAQKAKMLHENVTVVRLRRPPVPSDHDPEHRTVAWTHRWLVGGHWRNQWYPSLGLHRQVWISPFVKGPEDLPLVPRKGRIFTLVR